MKHYIYKDHDNMIHFIGFPTIDQDCFWTPGDSGGILSPYKVSDDSRKIELDDLTRLSCDQSLLGCLDYDRRYYYTFNELLGLYYETAE